ncbi:UDP-glycosyltransferase 79B6-like [Solanum tuberosum]|uniref:UDP-glycosyltransferase 79B6-like n=1 Tax=Solanum tuberosum TaxID=4113 RepID=UPI000739FF8E|nr:PREDICTED: UDP-glycosyltransferase 79B6-like [Solanum tuberosum]
MNIMMFPWLGFGHLVPYMTLSNELAKRGHKISFLLPKNAEIRLQKLNLYPNLIKFHKLTIPHVDGLPYGAKTTADVPESLETQEIGGIKTLFYTIFSLAELSVSPDKATFMASTAADLVKPPPDYPSTTVVLRESEAKLLSFLFHEYGKGVTFYERVKKGMTGCDAIGMRTCREIEGTFCDYIATHSEKPVLYTGPVFPSRKMSL